MAVIHGQIESLKKIRETLNQKGISRFNSIGDINRFLKNYDNEKGELLFKIERDYDLEQYNIQTAGLQLQKNHDAIKDTAETKLNNCIGRVKAKCTILSKSAKNSIMELLNWYRVQILLAIKFILERNFNNIIWLWTYKARKELRAARIKINGQMANRQEIISARCAPKFKELEHIKSVSDGLYPLIAGAIGENKVAKELEKLSDNHVLINDFSLAFEKPIFNKRKNDRIFSIQIDHLLVSQAGIFVIETKNWSKASIARFDLRSPVQQIRRTNFALYTILNGIRTEGGNILKQHHWGNREIPIRNVVAMIHNRPKERFKYVVIKTLKELNGYINYFDPIFDTSEVQNIVDYLMMIKKERANPG